MTKIIKLPSGRNAEHISIGVSKAKRAIQTTGVYSKTGFPKVNFLLGKGFWFGQSYVLCGSSGSGKSYLLNMIGNQLIRTDPMPILDKEGTPLRKPFPAINPHLSRTVDEAGIASGGVVWLRYGYEMKSEDEVIRTLSILDGEVSYGYFKQSQALKDEDGKYKKDSNNEYMYNSLSDKDKSYISAYLKAISKLHIYDISKSSTTEQLYNDCKYIHEVLGMRMIVSIDHYLLSDNDNTFQLAADTADVAARLTKDFNSLVIILSQMNDDINKRIAIPNRHFPEMADGYGGNTLYHGVDNYIFLFKPYKIGIEKYSRFKYKTTLLITADLVSKIKGLIKSDIGRILSVVHFFIQKGRFAGGEGTFTFFLDALHRGRWIPISEKYIK